jgi:fido (protein-threonine AMPylation protein)
MAYIYKKIIGNKHYYYLRISQRKGKKVITKDIAYLGSDIAKLQGKLDGLPNKYKAAIRKGHKAIKRFIDSQYYLKKVENIKHNPYFSMGTLQQVEAVKLHFTKEVSKLHSQTQEEIYEHFLIDFAYNTTSIEGNTITLEQADKLLRENLTPKEKSPREIFDLQNTQKVFFWLRENRPAFSQDLIITIHDKLLENIDMRKGYRDRDVRVFQSRFKTSPGKYVRSDMKLLFDWYKKNKTKLHPFVLACMFHHKFEKIHPFYDGNGRTGRMIMNFLLMAQNYPPLIIKKKHRSNYLATLADADKSGINHIDPAYFKKLIDYVASELIESYWSNFNI